MEDTIIRHGRTVEEAVEMALRDLGVSEDQVRVEVLEEGARGFLGIIGQRESQVRVSLLAQKDQFARTFLERVLAHIAPDTTVDVVLDEDFIRCNIDGESLGLVIGRRGETLNALQYLLNVTAGRAAPTDPRSIILDAGDFRSRRQRDLEEMVTRAASRVARSGRTMRLDPMPAHERKIVHTLLQKDDRVHTHSEGDEPNRFIVITSA